MTRIGNGYKRNYRAIFAAGTRRTRVSILFCRYQTVLQKRIDLLKRFDEHLQRSTSTRNQLQQLHDDVEHKSQLKIADIDACRAQLERYKADLRMIQSESSVLDRLMEESGSTIIDSASNRTVFFVVESRNIQNLVDIIDTKVGPMV